MTDARAHRIFEVWNYISLNPHATVRQIQRHFGWYSSDTVFDILDTLKRERVIEQPTRRHGCRKVLVTATYLNEGVAA
jgi:hypothetical protein